LPTLTDTNWKVCSERHFALAFYCALLWRLNLALYFLREPWNLVTGKTTANLSKGHFKGKAALPEFDSLDSLTEESVSL
jgi:hypothetical protein